jgi:hypothetical protein
MLKMVVEFEVLIPVVTTGSISWDMKLGLPLKVTEDNFTSMFSVEK